MKKTGFYLFLGMLAMSSIWLGCSDDDKDEPDPVPPVVEPEPDPEPVIDTVVMYEALGISNYVTGVAYGLEKFDYDTISGHVKEFEIGRSNPNNPFDNDAKVYKVNFKWEDKIVASYNEDGEAAKPCTATYTLNDKGWLDHVKLVKTTVTEEYQTEFTDKSFALYQVQNGTKTKLYSAEIAEGGTYGDWTVSRCGSDDGSVTVDVAYKDTEFDANFDFFLTTSYAGWLMPECILWAHVMGILPGNTKLQETPYITYGTNARAILYEWNMTLLSGGTLEATTLDKDYNEDAIDYDAIWESLPDISINWKKRVIERPAK